MDARVLIIEDDPNIRKLVAVNLRARGYEVMEAENGRQGLALLRAAPPSVLLLDIRLPDMSGWDLLGKLAADRAYPQVPVIVITASLGSARPEKPVYQKLRKVFIKPLSIQELTKEVKEALL